MDTTAENDHTSDSVPADQPPISCVCSSSLAVIGGKGNNNNSKQLHMLSAETHVLKHIVVFMFSLSVALFESCFYSFNVMTVKLQHEVKYRLHCSCPRTEAPSVTH